MKYNEDKLVNYGFSYDDGYVLQRTFDHLLITLKVHNDEIKENVYDMESEDLFLPYFQRVYGSYVGSVKEYVEDLKHDIDVHCIDNDTLEELHAFIRDELGVEGRYPFKDSGAIGYYTLENNKWFCLEMHIEAQKLQINSNELITVFNIKASADTLAQKIDSIHYFQAYHMNKSKWMTILIDSSVNTNEVKELLKESYKLVK